MIHQVTLLVLDGAELVLVLVLVHHVLDPVGTADAGGCAGVLDVAAHLLREEVHREENQRDT
jgi:hypothetical protein